MNNAQAVKVVDKASKEMIQKTGEVLTGSSIITAIKLKEVQDKEDEVAKHITQIAEEIRAEKDVSGRYLIVEAVNKANGRINLFNGGYLEIRDGILVVVDKRFKGGHAGRGAYQLAVYAADEQTVTHELTEMNSWLNFAVDHKDIKFTADDLKDLKNGKRPVQGLGVLLREYANTGSDEEKLTKQKELMAQYHQTHVAALRAEGTAEKAKEADDYEGSIDAKMAKMKKAQENFDFFIASDGGIKISRLDIGNGGGGNRTPPTKDNGYGRSDLTGKVKEYNNALGAFRNAIDVGKKLQVSMKRMFMGRLKKADSESRIEELKIFGGVTEFGFKTMKGEQQKAILVTVASPKRDFYDMEYTSEYILVYDGDLARSDWKIAKIYSKEKNGLSSKYYSMVGSDAEEVALIEKLKNSLLKLIPLAPRNSEWKLGNVLVNYGQDDKEVATLEEFVKHNPIIRHLFSLALVDELALGADAISFDFHGGWGGSASPRDNSITYAGDISFNGKSLNNSQFYQDRIESIFAHEVTHVVDYKMEKVDGLKRKQLLDWLKAKYPQWGKLHSLAGEDERELLSIFFQNIAIGRTELVRNVGRIDLEVINRFKEFGLLPDEFIFWENTVDSREATEKMKPAAYGVWKVHQYWDYLQKQNGYQEQINVLERLQNKESITVEELIRTLGFLTQFENGIIGDTLALKRLLSEAATLLNKISIRLSSKDNPYPENEKMLRLIAPWRQAIQYLENVNNYGKISERIARSAIVVDSATIVHQSNVGGIDLNSDQLKLNETGGKIDFSGPIDPAMLAQVAGFSPVVLSVTPMGDPQVFFGIAKN
ncbi:MAG: hypothetical protein WCI27_05040 [Candidatus Omnitrophota bacterium]